MAATLLFPQVLQAEAFTGAAFLTWSEASQNSYIRTSVTMASFIATRTNEATAECLDAWYTSSSGTQDGFIRKKIADNAEFHPSIVIMLVLEEACGSFAP